MSCINPSGLALRSFWTYAPDGCGAVADACTGQPCGAPGFKVTVDASGFGRLSTDGRAASMATLILSTRAARRDGAPCKGAPATRSGYWGDSFRADKNAWGSQMFYIDPDLSTTQSVALIQAYAQADLGRLVNAGEAAVVDVRATYAGGGSVSITAGLQINEADADSVKFNASNNSGGWSL